MDPGLRHTGWAILVDGKIVGRGVIIPPGKGKVPAEVVIAYVIPKLNDVILNAETGTDFAAAAVEQVAWYGVAKKIILPLAHVAGAITGFLLACGIDVFLLPANMKTSKLRTGTSWSEHEKDAALLADVAYRFKKAEEKADASYLKAHAAAQRRLIPGIPDTVWPSLYDHDKRHAP